MFKSQEPSLLMPSLNRFLFLILFYGLIIYPIKSPNHSMDMESAEVFSIETNKVSPCNSSHAPRYDFQHVLRLATFANLAPKLGQLQKGIQDHQVLMQLELSSGHCVYQRYQKNLCRSVMPTGLLKSIKNGPEAVNLFHPLRHQPRVHL